MRRAALARFAAFLALLPAAANASEHRYALSMMHFNVQYVAGGLVGSHLAKDPATAPDDREVEDGIVKQSFEPVLDLYLAHPTWGGDVEMQGYMLDVIAERHPDVLEKLRTLANAGRLEVVSFHYSDQLFVGHAKEDWERSAQLNQATFAKHGVPLGKAVFCQEGQSSEGMAAAMTSHGYRTLVWPKNLFSYQHQGLQPKPLYQFGGARMLTSNGLTYTEGTETLNVTWTFVDDGELLATGGINPYIWDAFVVNPKAVADYEASVVALEQQGFQVITVSSYVDAISSWVTPAIPPPLLDGTWQPGSTDGTYRWMGKGGLEERDGDVRSALALAHRELVLAETAAQGSGLDARARLDAGWRVLMLGEVSDATGVNPWRSEVEYGLAYAAEALRVARDVIDDAKAKAGASTVIIDSTTGTFTAGTEMAAARTDEDPPFALAIDGARGGVVTWQKATDGHHIATVTFSPTGSREASVRFPGSGDEIVYTPALADTPVHRKRADFTFDHFDLALHDGLIGLGGGRWVVKDQAFVHVGARVRIDATDVQFHEDTMSGDDTVTWVFHVLDADEATAVAFAGSLNLRPRAVR